MANIENINTEIDNIQEELNKKNSKINNVLIDNIQKYRGMGYEESLLKKTKSVLEQFNKKLNFNEKTLEAQLSNLIEWDIKIEENLEEITKIYKSGAYTFLSNELKELLENGLQSNDISKFQIKFILFMSNFNNWNLEEAEKNIEKIFNIKDYKKLTPEILDKNISQLFSENKMRILANNIFWKSNSLDFKVDIFYKIWRFFNSKWDLEKSTDFLEFALKKSKNLDTKKDILSDLKIIKEKLNKKNLKKRYKIKEANNKKREKQELKNLKKIDDIFKDLWEILDLNILDLNISWNELENNNLDKNNFDILKNNRIFEEQKNMLKKLWFDISKINNQEELLSQIWKIISENNIKLEEIKNKNLKIKENKKEFDDKISKIEEIIDSIEKDLERKVKKLDEILIKRLKLEKNVFKNKKYFLWTNKNSRESSENWTWWRDENIWNDYDIGENWTNNFGFWEKNELNYEKWNFLIDWLKWNYVIPDKITPWYSLNWSALSKEYIKNLKNYDNESNKDLDVFYYKEIEKWKKIFKIDVPEWYKVVTNQVSFWDEKISYNIVRGKLGITFLLFEEKLEENTGVKIWFEKDSEWSTEKINTTWSRKEVWKNLNSKNKNFLDSLDKNISILEKVELVKKHILENSYYSAWWIDVKEWKNNIWQVENLELKQWKRPLICNLANNQFVAYLKYIWVEAVYVSGLSHWGYWEYLWHWWIKYFDWNKRVKDDATPPVDSLSSVKTNYQDKELEKIEAEKQKSDKLKKMQKSKKWPLEKKQKKLQENLNKNNLEISRILKKNKELEKLLNWENKEDIEVTVENSKDFEEEMNKNVTKLIKNIKILKQESDKLDRTKNTPVFIITKLSSEEESKLNVFNEKLDKYLKYNINKIILKLNNDENNFWIQYANLVWLTSLLNNFKDEIYKIDPNLNKKLEILKSKIKNESLFLDEVEKFWNMSYIKIWDELFTKKGKFELEPVWVEIEREKFLYKNWKKSYYIQIKGEKNKYLEKNNLKNKNFKEKNITERFSWITYENKEWKIFRLKNWNNKENLNIINGLKAKNLLKISNLLKKGYKFDSIENYDDSSNNIKKISFLIKWGYKYLYYDIYENKVYDEDSIEIEWISEWIYWQNKILFFNKKELIIKNSNLKELYKLENVDDFKLIENNYIKQEHILVKQNNKIHLFKITDNWFEKIEELAYLNLKNISFTSYIWWKIIYRDNSDEFIYKTYWEKENYWRDNNLLELTAFLWNNFNDIFLNNLLEIIKNKITTDDRMRMRMGMGMRMGRDIDIENVKIKDIISHLNMKKIIEWKNWNKYIVLKDFWFLIKDDWELIDIDNSYYDISIDKNGNIYTQDKNWIKIKKDLSNDNYLLKNFSYTTSKISFNNWDWEKIKYKASYSEVEYVEEFRKLIERKNIVYFTKEDFEFVIFNMKDYNLNKNLLSTFNIIYNKWKNIVRENYNYFVNVYWKREIDIYLNNFNYKNTMMFELN